MIEEQKVLSSKKVVVFFDYDNTLVKGDSLWPFLVLVAGWRQAFFALLSALPGAIFTWFKGKDYRTFIKERLLLLLAGRNIAELTPVLERMKRWPKAKEQIMKKLKEHYAVGHHIVIASGSLDLYLPALLEDVPHHAVLCTEMEIIDGKVTGYMKSGNCVRTKKAEMVAGYMATHGPFEDSWGYGNAPNDMPMLNLVKHRTIVE